MRRGEGAPPVCPIAYPRSYDAASARITKSPRRRQGIGNAEPVQRFAYVVFPVVLPGGRERDLEGLSHWSQREVVVLEGMVPVLTSQRTP